MKTTNRFLSFFLALAMVFSLFSPGLAYAEAPEEEGTIAPVEDPAPVPDDPAAPVGDGVLDVPPDDSDSTGSIAPAAETEALPRTDGTQEYHSGTCGDNLDWELEDGVLTISGTGMMENYSGSIHPDWYEFRESISSVVIESGATNIGSYAFHGGNTGVNYPNLTTVSIPDTVQVIGNYAFYKCTALSGAALPAGLKTLATYSFCGTGLTAVTIPASLSTFESDVFRDCASLQSVTVEDGVTRLGLEAFLNCTALESVSIPASVKTFGSYVFKGCTSLRDVTLSEGLMTLGIGMFNGCTSLAGITLPQSLTEVPNYAFMSCSALAEITFPVNVSTIGNSAFQNCTALKKIYFRCNAPASVNSSAFSGLTASAYYPYFQRKLDRGQAAGLRRQPHLGHLGPLLR